jgi:alpha-beta hydrolase superfamily lysophospholipase
MPKRCLRWLWTHRKLTIALVLFSGFVLLNIIAYNHAHAMTHFREGGPRTAAPEKLSFLQKAQVLFRGVSIPRPGNLADPASQGLVFETLIFQGKDGIELEAWHVPNPKARGLVMLLHGYAACKASLLGEARAFHELGYSCVLLDLRGSGGSAGNETTIGVTEADDLALVVQRLQEAHPDQPLILYGQSMGSVAILRAVSENGVRPTAVIVECPFDRLLSTVTNRFSAMGLPSFPGAQLLVYWGGVQLGFNGFRHNPVDYARGVSCPALLMHGDQDPRVTTEQAQSIFGNLAGKKRFESFPGVGHQSYLGAQPELWKQTVSEFLGEYSQ